MKPELLIPASGPDTLRVAVQYGADAVYIGGSAYSLRAKARNFSLDEMRQGIAFAHANGVKVYVTANVFARDADFAGLRAYFEALEAFEKDQPDALIVSDPGVFALAQEACPSIDLHISTQANNTNAQTARFWHQQGAKRIVSARELSLDELARMRREMPPEMELETFVHGAMCISYSGRCLLSAALAGRDANRGACAHPCRWEYRLEEVTRPGEYLSMEEDDRGTYLMNSRDLCMVGHLPQLLAAGIDSLKVEGRMKNALYVAVCARTYRQAIDDAISDPDRYQSRLDWYRSEIDACTHRPFFTGFFFGDPGPQGQVYEESTYEQPYVFLGITQEDAADGWIGLTQKNKFSVGEIIEVMEPDGTNTMAEVREILDPEGISMQSAPHAGQRLRVRLSVPVSAGRVLRRKKMETGTI